MLIATPFHEGELLVQERAGERATAVRNGSVIADTIIKGALRFISQQSFIVVGSMDDAGRVWASVLVGEAGFMTATEKAIDIDLARTLPNPSDPFWKNIEGQSKIGALIIELTRRRRLRVNGKAVRVGGDRLRIDVLESYPNCPKYIQRRNVSVDLERVAGSPSIRRGSVLGADQAAWIGDADTMFVASAHAERGVDASHRGGKPGFVRVIDAQTLRIPDYAGNSMFNTLGNFAANPQAGLLFIDFESGRTLQLVGKATILWDHDELDHETGGTRRYWEFAIKELIETDSGRALASEFIDYSPFNP